MIPTIFKLKIDKNSDSNTTKKSRSERIKTKKKNIWLIV